MGKKVLIISPTPTHLTTAGNRSRIVAVCELLKKEGFELNFLLAAQEPFDKEALQEYWGKQLFLYEGNCFLYEKSLKDRIIEKGLKWFGRKLNIDSLKYNSGIDSYYPSGLNTYLKQHLLSHIYEVVIVEYAVYSKALLQFPKNVLKIVDTHDKFGNRYETYTKNGLQPNWYSLFPNAEFKGLNRADVVLAIQEREAEYFSSNTKASVITLGHVAVFAPCRNEASNAIIFTASDNIINVNAINYFICNILSSVLQKNSTIKLLLAGSICNSKALKIPNSLLNHIELLGLFVDTREVYSKASVAINPVKVGTGLKIKVIEALAHGLPIVSFAKSNESIVEGEPANYALEICSDDYEFAEAVIRAMKLTKELSEKSCISFISSYNNKNSKPFLQVLNNEERNN